MSAGTAPHLEQEATPERLRPDAHPGHGEVAVLRRLRLAMTAGLAALAGLGFHEVFSWPQVIRTSFVAALIPTLIVGFCSRRGRSLALSASISVAVFVVTSGLFLFHTVGGIGADVVDATVNGWARVLTTTIPADPNPDLVFLPFVATWASAAIGGELVVRTRARLGSALPGIAALVFSELFSVGLDSGRILTALVAVGLIGGLALTDPADLADSASGPNHEAGDATSTVGQRVARAGGALLAVIVFAMVVGPHLPGQGGDRFDPRRDQAPPNDPRQAVNPLVQLAGWHTGNSAKAQLFEVRATRSGPVILRFRLVALDHYDGRTWSEGEGYRSVGVVLPEEPDLTPVPTVDVDQFVTIKNLTGIWLPAADRPTRIEGASVLQNQSSGALVRRQGTITDLQYGVASAVRTPSQEAMRAAGAPMGDESLGSPELPREITTLATRWTQAGVSPYEKALLIKQQLIGGDFKVDTKALPGHDLPRLEDFLGVSKSPPTAGAKRGDAEQFATAFAVVARAAGLPSRVVVGFDAGKPKGDRYTVRGTQATAWVEIHFDGLGWVPFDALPTDASTRTEEEKKLDEEKLKQEQSLSETIKDPDRKPPIRQPPPPPPEPEPSLLEQVARGLAATLVVVIVTAVVYLGLLAFVRTVRRRSRRTAVSPRERVLGAWRDAIDELVVRGFHLHRDMTVGDILQAAHGMAPQTSSLDSLGRLVNQVRFADLTCDDEDAERAWSTADDLRTKANDGAGLLTRLRVLANPRSLLVPY